MNQNETLTYEVATSKPCLGVPMRLASVGVFYRNDQPNGFGFMLNLLQEDDLRFGFQAYKDDWDSHPAEHEEILNTYMAQVEDFARRTPEEKHGIGVKFGLIMTLNVMWLVMEERIPNDNFNGTQFVWEVEKQQEKGLSDEG